jgi:hypothetical protein
MTHDKLLAKIKSFTCCSGAHELALIAVMEIHKPIEITLPGGIKTEDCSFCVGNNYPCETIQYIDKNLS